MADEADSLNDAGAEADLDYVGYQLPEYRSQALHAAMHPSLGGERAIDNVLADAEKILAFLTGESK